jgi:hypothetical protein
MTVLVYTSPRDIWDLRSTRIVGMPGVPEDVERRIVEILTRHDMTYRDIASPGRYSTIGNCRAEISHYLRSECHWTFPRIGRWMKKDHSSIVYMLEKRGWFKKGVSVPMCGPEIVQAAKDCQYGAKKASRHLGIHHSVIKNIRRGQWDHVL